MSEFLTQQLDAMQTRIAELEPAVTEYQTLKAGLEVMRDSGAAGAALNNLATQRAARRTTPTRTRSASGGPTRKDQALKAVQADPGLTIPRLAEQMGIQANYLYKVMPDLASEGKVRKQGDGWFPAS